MAELNCRGSFVARAHARRYWLRLQKNPTATSKRLAHASRHRLKKRTKTFGIALDRASGKTVWQREVPRARTGRLQNVNNPASPSPVTDGTNVYIFFQEFGLVSYDRAGKERWKLPLGPFSMFYGFGASPILVDDKIVLPVRYHISTYRGRHEQRQVSWKVNGLV